MMLFNWCISIFNRRTGEWPEALLADSLRAIYHCTIKLEHDNRPFTFVLTSAEIRLNESEQISDGQAAATLLLPTML